MSGRGRSIALSPAASTLVRAFLPGAGSTLRSIKAEDWRSLTFHGERISIEFDLDDRLARSKAFRLVDLAPKMEVHGLPGAILADVAAKVTGDVLSVECLVVED